MHHVCPSGGGTDPQSGGRVMPSYLADLCGYAQSVVEGCDIALAVKGKAGDAERVLGAFFQRIADEFMAFWPPASSAFPTAGEEALLVSEIELYLIEVEERIEQLASDGTPGASAAASRARRWLSDLSGLASTVARRGEELGSMG